MSQAIPVSEPSGYVDVARAAEISGLSIQWWRRAIQKRRVRFYQIGRRTLIDPQDIQEMFDHSRVEPSAPTSSELAARA